LIYATHFKRLLDVLLSSIAIIIVLVPMIFMSLWIIFDSRGPVFFVQKRLGWQGRIFSIYKFRTMQHKLREFKEQVFTNHPEVTRSWKFLRRFKLDEIPQFFNVLKVDMSFIGPRPCLPELQDRFDENGYARLKVPPGLFGLADIKGGYFLSWPYSWVHDRYYVKHISFLLNVKLVLISIPTVLFDEDFYLKRN